MARALAHFGLTLRVDVQRFERDMQGFERNIPFAISVSLNRTADEAVKELKASADEDLTIRTPWVARGIRFQRSTKKDLIVRVGSVDEFMAGQVLGGKRQDDPGASKPSEAIPMTGRGRPRSTEQSVTRPAKWPGALAERPNTFIGVVKTKVGPLEGVWERIQKKKNIRRQGQWSYVDGKKVWHGGRQHVRERKSLKSVRLLYLFEWKVDLKPKWMLLERVQKTFGERWEGQAVKAMKEAIETSRERASGR